MVATACALLPDMAPVFLGKHGHNAADAVAQLVTHITKTK
jgi:hypothetical protein